MHRLLIRWTPALALAVVAGPVVAQDPAWVTDARKVATALPPKLVATLTEEISKGGVEGAIVVCRETAPKLAKAASDESGWNVRRVSLRNRNPKAVPDAWERTALEDFDRRAAAGEPPATLEKAERVSEHGKATYRYIRALPVQPLCVSCHGTPEEIGPATLERLRSLYPNDKATDYRPGEIRGAMTLRKPA